MQKRLTAMADKYSVHMQSFRFQLALKLKALAGTPGEWLQILVDKSAEEKAIETFAVMWSSQRNLGIEDFSIRLYL